MKSRAAEECRKDVLQRRVQTIAFLNLLIVALLGLLLRSFSFIPVFPLSYKNILHGHSHFAFGGWVTPVLLALLLKFFPEIKTGVAFRHWRNIALLILLSAYGMLVSFPLQGYGPVSIAFSTVSIAATVYLAIVVWKAAENAVQKTSVLFLKYGLLYAGLSAIGPFATGPLVAMGKGGSAVYFDAIYFYLHFQYNGFFSFLILAFVYKLIEKNGPSGNGKKVFVLLNYACLPTYALSVLWSGPSLLFNLVGGIGAVLQVVALFYLRRDILSANIFKKNALLKLSFFALAMKIGLQLLSAFPAIALMAYQNRNFVIAYLHLVLLGFISLFIFGIALRKNMVNRIGVKAFLFSFITTELLLVINASSGLLHFDIPYFIQLLLFCSLFFPVGVMLMLFSFVKRKRELIKDSKTRAVVATLSSL